MPSAILRIASNERASPRDLPVVSVMGNDEYTAECPEGHAGDPVTVAAGAHTAETFAAANAAAVAAAEAALECNLIYYNVEVTFDCPGTSIGDSVTIPAGTYSSIISQADADQQAADAAQAALDCHWENELLILNCPEGYTGDPVVIPAGTYESEVSQEDADAQALAAAQAALECVLDEFPDLELPIDGAVLGIALQEDGKLVLGGDFGEIAGVTRENAARLDTDGTLDSSFDPAPNAFVEDVAVRPDGKIIVVGAFTEIVGTTRNVLALLNSDGSLDSGYTFGVAPGASAKTAVANSDNSAFIGSYIAAHGGVIKAATDGSLDTSFDPDANSDVYAIAVQGDGKILIGGDFTNVDGSGRNRCARLNTDGTPDSFNPNLNSTVDAVVVDASGKVYIGGSFTTVGGTTRQRFARLNSDGTLDTSWTQNLNSACRDLLVQADGKILVAGEFTTIGGVSQPRLARLNTDGTLDTGFTPDLDGPVQCMATSADDSFLYVGGYFNTADGQTRRAFARLNLSDGSLA